MTNRCDRGVQKSDLFDDLFGASKQRRRHEAERRLGGPEIDHQLKPRRLPHRKVGRNLAPEDTAGIDTSVTMGVGPILSVAH